MNETPDLDDVYTAAFAAELRSERAVKNIPFAEIEEATGINQRTLFRLFKGERDLKASHLIRITAALGVTPQDLITRTQKRVDEGTVPDAQ